MTDLTVVIAETNEPIRRSVSLTNEEWAILAMCAEAYSNTFRTKQSEVIATYVTRNQIPEALGEAQKMNSLLQTLDKLQASLV